MWDGPEGALKSVVSALRHPSQHNYWDRLMVVHPNPSDRISTITDTSNLFRMNAWDAFGASVAATIAFANLAFQISLSLPVNLENQSYLLTSLLYASFAGGIVGLVVWRGVIAAFFLGNMLKNVGLFGISMGLGVSVGQFLSFSEATGLVNSGSFEYFVMNVLFLLFNIVAFYLFVHWIAAGAKVWVGATSNLRSLRIIYIIGLLVAGFLIVVVQTFSLTFYNMGKTIGIFPAIIYAVSALMMNRSIIFFMFVTLWAFPLSALLFRGRTGVLNNIDWMFLDPPSQLPVLTQQYMFRVKLSLLVVLVSVIIFSLIVPITVFALRSMMPENIRSTDWYKIALLYGFIVLAGIIQGGIAAIIASNIRDLVVIYGLFAAFVGGFLMSLSFLIINFLFGGSITFAFAWEVIIQITIIGTLVALPTVIGISLLRALFRSPA